MSREGDDSSRRRFLKATGAAVAGVLAASGTAAADDGPFPGRFHVEGRKITRRKVTPEAVTTTVRRVSPDLRKRYGRATTVTTRTFERPADTSKDPYPRHGTDVWNRRWDTYYAKEDEWRSLAADDGWLGTTADHRWVEEAHPYGTWEYEPDDSGGYEVAGPMNVVTPAAMNDVVDVLASNGYTTYVVQWDRHAWNSATDQFEQQHASAATGTFGFLGRNHVRFWEFEGYTTGSAHVDSAVPHEATSYEDCEQHIEGVFDDANGWFGWDDYYDLDNGSKLDHDGSATRPYKF